VLAVDEHCDVGLPVTGQFFGDDVVERQNVQRDAAGRAGPRP